MRTPILSLVAVLVLASSVGVVAAAPKRKAAKAVAAPPAAKVEEIDKLKGQFKWGMSPDDVMTKIVERVEATYDERLKKTVNDPTKQDRVRKEMRAEVELVRKTSLIKFEGQKSGYDVAIIGSEFVHGNNESMLVAREDTAQRYFFFEGDRLYKMFLAFDKEMLQGKSFTEFGALMQAKFGPAREVVVEEKTKAGVTKKVDHYVWSAKSGDGLRLVDRSGFFDVFCLVVYEGEREARLAEVRKSKQKGYRTDPMVDVVTNRAGSADRDANDNVVDRIVGRPVHRPGDEPAQGDIKVPSPTTQPASPTPSRAEEAPVPDDKPKGGKNRKDPGLKL